MLAGPEPSRSDGTLAIQPASTGGRPGSNGATEQTCRVCRDKELRSQIRFPAVAEKTCVMFFLPLPSQAVANHQQMLHLRSLVPPSPVPSSPFPLLSSHPILSFHPGFSCFAAQRGAEPRIPRANCHVKTLILAKFHTQRLHPCLKEL